MGNQRGLLLMAAGWLAVVVLSGCSAQGETGQPVAGTKSPVKGYDASIVLSDEEILVDGKPISTQPSAAVYVGADIVYYEEGRGASYGRGTQKEEHSKEDAKRHQVITITEPGVYCVSGKLSAGQLAVDLGKGAKKDPEAVVELILDNVDITCEVAPAIMVYRVYECGSDSEKKASKDIDVTDKAGFYLTLADGSENTVTASHVAGIYKEGTTEEEIAKGKAKNAVKYDAAIESQMSVCVKGQEAGTGKLTVYADKEGIETKLHMAINGGELVIHANDDSLNAGTDHVSVITINGGTVFCNSGSGNGEEGDGIDSNGWIVINGGYVFACANKESMDSGLDSDEGIYINGGTVFASGNMYDEVSEASAQKFMVLSFEKRMPPEKEILLTDAEGKVVFAFSAYHDYSVMVYSAPDLQDGEYRLYQADGRLDGQEDGASHYITEYEGAMQLGYTNTEAGGFGRGPKPGPLTDGGMPETVFSLQDGQYQFGGIREAPASLARPFPGK